jgi:hypothetical protein
MAFIVALFCQVPIPRVNCPSMADNPSDTSLFSEDSNFLDHYFANIYLKLEADALLFNRKIPHTSLVGSENEQALGMLLRDFLPRRFGVEVGAIIIDKHGKASKQVDILIYNAEQPKFFRKVFPIEIVYAAIEVKTSMGQTEAEAALQNISSINNLDFRPGLTNYWKTKTTEQKIHHYPPTCFVFAYRTNCQSFETFARWFPVESLNDGIPLKDAAPVHPEIRTIRIAALDQGTIEMESTNGYVHRTIAVATDNDLSRAFDTTMTGEPVRVDPAKALFLFMTRLWFDLEVHPLHPGFDIRSYTSRVLGTVMRVENEHIF